MAARWIAAGVMVLFVTTGLTLPNQPDQFAVLADSASETWLVTTARRRVDLGGIGDAFSALFLGHYLATADLRVAMDRAGHQHYSLSSAMTVYAGCLRSSSWPRDYSVK